MRPCAEAAIEVTVRNGTLKARVDRVRGGRRNMDRLGLEMSALSPVMRSALTNVYVMSHASSSGEQLIGATWISC